MAIGHDENRHIVRLAGLAPEGRESDLSLICRGVDHVMAEGAHMTPTALGRPEIPLCPFERPFEEVGVPNRTSYELHLPVGMSAWYSAVDF
jgi:hypothetical protein